MWVSLRNPVNITHKSLPVSEKDELMEEKKKKKNLGEWPPWMKYQFWLDVAWCDAEGHSKTLAFPFPSSPQG